MGIGKIIGIPFLSLGIYIFGVFSAWAVDDLEFCLSVSTECLSYSLHAWFQVIMALFLAIALIFLTKKGWGKK